MLSAQTPPRLPRSRGWNFPKEVLRYQLQTHHTLLPQEGPKNTLFTRITESLHQENAESRHWTRTHVAGRRRANVQTGGILLIARARAPRGRQTLREAAEAQPTGSAQVSTAGFWPTFKGSETQLSGTPQAPCLLPTQRLPFPAALT